MPPPSDEPTIYSSLIQQALFHQVGNACYNRVISAPPPPSAEAISLDLRLRQWHEQLPVHLKINGSGQDPPWLAFSAQKLFWRYCNLRIIIGRRAFLERALNSASTIPTEEADAQSAAICLEAALDSIRAIGQFCDTHLANRLERWYEL
jgi:transcriptional regulatory protein GAL4